MTCFAAAPPAAERPAPQVRVIDYRETAEERRIFSYVQVPESYCYYKEWAGDWTDIEAGGQRFFSFGCGICCLSNMCSTLTGSFVRPDEMFERVRTCTDYDPDSGVGALSWKQLAAMCDNMGLAAEIRNKPEDYAVFQTDAGKADTMLVLVCRYNDDKLWFYTKGHYVNLWNYDPETDTVFVTDSSGLYNRDRVRLYDVYRALKTSSDAQYMCVKVREDNFQDQCEQNS